MSILYDAKCKTPTCERLDKVIEVRAEGVKDNEIVGQVCEACRGALRRVISPVNIGGKSKNASDPSSSRGGWFDRLLTNDRGVMPVGSDQEVHGSTLAAQIASGDREVESVVTVPTSSGNVMDVIITRGNGPEGGTWN